MADLSKERCVPCSGGAPAVEGAERERLLADVPGWQVAEEGGVPRLHREFRFGDFKEALVFADRIGAAAEEQGHHPVLTVEWGKATVDWYTTAINNLHRNDFIMAARTGELYQTSRDG